MNMSPHKNNRRNLKGFGGKHIINSFIELVYFIHKLAQSFNKYCV